MKLSNAIDKQIEKNQEMHSNKQNVESIFPEHEFINSCLQIHLSITDLEKITYIDAMKMILSHIIVNDDLKQSNNSNVKMATQADIDRLLG